MAKQYSEITKWAAANMPGYDKMLKHSQETWSGRTAWNTPPDDNYPIDNNAPDKLKERVRYAYPDALKNRQTEALAQTAGIFAPSAAKGLNWAFKMPLPAYARAGLGVVGAGSRAYADNNNSVSHEALRYAMNLPSVATDINRITEAVGRTTAANAARQTAKIMPADTPEWVRTLHGLMPQTVPENIERISNQGQRYFNAVSQVAKDKNFAQPELNTAVGQVAAPILAGVSAAPGAAWVPNAAYTGLNLARYSNLSAQMQSDVHDIAGGKFVPDTGMYGNGMTMNYFLNPVAQFHGRYINDLPVDEYRKYLAAKKQLDEKKTLAAEAETRRRNTWKGRLADAFSGMANAAAVR